MHAGVGTIAAGTHDHVVALVEFRQQGRQILRLVLAVGIHEHEHVAARGPGAGLDRSAVAHGIGMGDQSDAVGGTDVGRVVGGTVVHDNYLATRQHVEHASETAGQARGLRFSPE